MNKYNFDGKLLDKYAQIMWLLMPNQINFMHRLCTHWDSQMNGFHHTKAHWIGLYVGQRVVWIWKQLSFFTFLCSYLACSKFLVHCFRYQHYGFNLTGFNFNQFVVDSQGSVINTWVKIINRTNLGLGKKLKFFSKKSKKSFFKKMNCI